jgi:excisionase family DNA binding protein
LEIPGSHIVGMVRQSEQLLTLTEAGERFGLSPVTLRVLVNQGRLAATKRGRDWFVTASAVRAYLTSRKPAGRPPTPEGE